MINYFKAAERTLDKRLEFAMSLGNLRRRRVRLIASGVPDNLPGMDLNRIRVASSVSADALSDCVEVANLTRAIANTEEAIREIDDVISQLPKTEADLLQLWYVERLTKAEIAQTLNMASSSTLYSWRNKAIMRFAVLYFGADALS